MTRVKICGIRSEGHALAAVEAGADLIGLVFAPSKRRVTPVEGREIASVVRQYRATLNAAPVEVIETGKLSKDFDLCATNPQVVGVFVNSAPSEVNRIADFCSLDWVQLSGDESWEYCREIIRPVIKAIRIGGQSPEAIRGELSAGEKLLGREKFMALLDSQVEGSYGGTGTTFDWNLAKQVARKFPVIIAGGLDPENVSQAITVVSPWGVDVSSGVETGGVKNVARMTSFIEAVRKADTSKVITRKAKQFISESKVRQVK